MGRTRKTSGGSDKKNENNGILSESLTSTPVPSATTILSTNKSTNITEQDILSAQNNNDLMKIIHTLTNTKQDEIFTNYKKKSEVQLQQKNQLINDMQQELNNKQKIIDKLLEEKPDNGLLQTPMKKARSELQNMYVSPIRRKKTAKQEQEVINQDQLSKELETIGITLDRLELLTGLRIINYEEDDAKFHFDLKQTSTNGSGTELTIDYRLIISKEFTSTAEINYVPTFLNELEDNDSESDEIDVDDETMDSKRNAKMLLDLLPDYFCDNLTFPYNTLSQFYTKMNRALNKGAKS